MKKAVPALVAILLILIIAGGYAGKLYLDKYSYSTERVDLDNYYDVESGKLVTILQDERIEEKVTLTDNVCYFDLDTVHKYLNEGFYADFGEGILLYTTANTTYKVAFGEAVDGVTSCYLAEDTLYVALDYVKKFTNFSYQVFDRKVQLYTQWGQKQIATVKKATAVREKGGVKSSILCDLNSGDTVEVLEQMENWSKVKTDDSYIGYVENKLLSAVDVINEVPVTDYVADEYTTKLLDTKVSLGWHAIGGVGGNDTLDSMTANAVGMNVVAPTWFSLNDNAGGFRNFGSSAYVAKAHGKGYKVWGVLDDFNYNNENSAGIDMLTILSSTSTREKLVKNVCDTAVSLGLDGINVDFERVTSESGIHYVQFLRELSVACRERGLTLSVDNYVPFNFNNYYRLDIQGQIVDYVIIMGYDEHWHGSKEPGSVASINYVSNGLDKTLEDVPAEKVVNALPFYTILWKTTGADVTDEYITLANQADFISRTNADIIWDETTCQNYSTWEKGDTTYQIWYEDAESIGVKLNVMNTKNIGGVAAWRLGYDTRAIWELINSYVKQ